MFLSPPLYFTDTVTRLGKARAPLPQEYELAAFIRDVENPYPTWNTSTPACKWKSVICSKEGRVQKVNWSWNGDHEMPRHFNYRKLRGILHWNELPGTITSVRVTENAFRGTVCFRALPHELVLLQLERNAFEGTLDLNELPQKLLQGYVSFNKFYRLP